MDIIQSHGLEKALIREIITGEQLKLSLQKEREMACAKEAQHARDHGTKNWKLLASVPQHEYFKMRQWIGEDCWNDRGFVKHFQKTQPHLAAAKA